MADEIKTFGEVGGGTLDPRRTGRGIIQPGAGAARDSAFSERQKPRSRRWSDLLSNFSGVGNLFKGQQVDTTGWAKETAEAKAKTAGARLLKLRLPK